MNGSWRDSCQIQSRTTGRLMNCVDLACEASCNDFVSTAACQDYFQKEWYGDISTDSSTMGLFMYVMLFFPVLFASAGQLKAVTFDQGKFSFQKFYQAPIVKVRISCDPQKNMPPPRHVRHVSFCVTDYCYNI